MKLDTTKLTETLRNAIVQAQEAIKGVEDGGTCNFDSVFLGVGKNAQIPRKSGSVEKAIQDSGATYWFNSGLRRGYVVDVGVGGQGYTRTRAVELACQVLKAAGFDAAVWYQAD